MMEEVLRCTEKKVLTLGQEIPVTSYGSVYRKKQPVYLESNFLKIVFNDLLSKARDPEDSVVLSP